MGKYHFIAIGGIGMSGLAKYLLEEGNSVTGSDIEDSKYTDALKKLGAKVYIGHDEKNLPADAVVIVSTAIRESNPELMKAKELGLKIYHRSDLLLEISEKAQENGKTFIGFSGTHGKTTTSGMASFVTDRAGLDSSFVVGGIVPDIHTNSQHKNGKYFIAELDESDGTIVKYSPDILVINNLEADHLDYYKNGLEDLISTFETEISKSKKVLINNDNEGCLKLKGDFITFGLNSADYMAKNIVYSKGNTKFDIFFKGNFLTNMEIQIAGVHNVYNTLAVVAALNEAGININSVKPYFNDFTGMGRRFQKVTEFNGISIYDDYAHHPSEIKATLQAAAQKFGKENIVAVFQPHRYTRLKGLWNDFKKSFDNAGRVIVTDIYSASEDPIDGIRSDLFVKENPDFEYVSGDMRSVAEKILPSLSKGNVVIGLGAGTITSLGKNLDKLVSNKV